MATLSLPDVSEVDFALILCSLRYVQEHPDAAAWVLDTAVTCEYLDPGEAPKAGNLYEAIDSLCERLNTDRTL